MPKPPVPNPATIIEIGVEVTQGQLKGLLCFLRSRKIPTYVEPQRKLPWTSLADLEAACESK